jgi:hypothetical protein
VRYFNRKLIFNNLVEKWHKLGGLAKGSEILTVKRFNDDVLITRNIKIDLGRELKIAIEKLRK